nr:ABC transporter substrate-binding protein [Halomarina sp. PSRA2]
MTDSELTRRRLLGGTGIAAGGLLAGCLGGPSAGDSNGSAGGGPANGTDGTNDTGDEGDGSYTVTLSPVGDVEFDAVPESVMAYSPHYADMAVAFGHGASVNSLGFTDGYGETAAYFYDALDGVSFEVDGLTQLFNEGMDKEVYYELDSDVHLMDPCWAMTFDAWSEADVEDVRRDVGPWFGNRYSRQHSEPPEGCRDGYEYYSLWELCGKVADVFRERERFEALSAMHDDLIGTIESALPPEDERPTVGQVAFYDERFSPYRINGPGFGRAHTAPLGARDVFADSDRTYAENYEASYDFEGMLEYDPDVVLHHFAITPFYEFDSILETVRDHPVGSQLSAVENDRFYASGTAFQGPIVNLFQLEMTAKQLYPDLFGEWPGYEDGDSYPEVPEDERLFDRDELATVVRGE